MRHWHLLILRALAAFALIASVACSSRSAREILEEKQSGSRARAAAYAADGFYKDGNFPEKPVSRDSDFFFKHCDLVGRHPYPSVSDWECTEAPQ